MSYIKLYTTSPNSKNSSPNSKNSSPPNSKISHCPYCEDWSTKSPKKTGGKIDLRNCNAERINNSSLLQTTKLLNSIKMYIDNQDSNVAKDIREDSNFKNNNNSENSNVDLSINIALEQDISYPSKKQQPISPIENRPNSTIKQQPLSQSDLLLQPPSPIKPIAMFTIKQPILPPLKQRPPPPIIRHLSLLDLNSHLFSSKQLKHSKQTKLPKPIKYPVKPPLDPPLDPPLLSPSVELLKVEPILKSISQSPMEETSIRVENQTPTIIIKPSHNIVEPPIITKGMSIDLKVAGFKRVREFSFRLNYDDINNVEIMAKIDELMKIIDTKCNEISNMTDQSYMTASVRPNNN
jgi:hypothetical protein